LGNSMPSSGDILLIGPRVASPTNRYKELQAPSWFGIDLIKRIVPAGMSIEESITHPGHSQKCFA
jgi:hypothetical protein